MKVEDVDKAYSLMSKILTVEEMLHRTDKKVRIFLGEYSIPVVFENDSAEANSVVEMIRAFANNGRKEIENIGKEKILESSESCDTCKFVIRNGEDENDGCSGSHPVEIAAGDFLCNRWEKCDEKK